MNPKAVEARTAGAKTGIVTRIKTPARLLPQTSPASSKAASIALKAGVINMKRTEVLNAK